MSVTEERRIGLSILECMLLVAGVAFAVACSMRFGVAVGGFDGVWDRPAQGWTILQISLHIPPALRVATPAMSICSLTLVALACLRTGRPLSRLVAQPGAVSAAVAAITIALAVAFTVSYFAVASIIGHEDWRVLFPPRLDESPILFYTFDNIDTMASSIGLATLTSWVLLRTLGSRTIAPDLVEILARIVGVYWILMVIVKLWEESNIYSTYLRDL